MTAASFILVQAEKKLTMTFVRDLSKNVSYLCYDSDIVMFLDKAYFKDESSANLMMQDNIIVVKLFVAPLSCKDIYIHLIVQLELPVDLDLRFRSIQMSCLLIFLLFSMLLLDSRDFFGCFAHFVETHS